MIVKDVEDIKIFEDRLSINVDHRTFKTLIDGIYTNKISSVIREIGVNAKDSHILANNLDPYTIYLHLDSFENVSKVVVQDYGVGLSRDEAERYLCSLNSSSKREDDTQTGFFGIGSKSPLSISQNYEFVCVKDGKKTLVSFVRIDGAIPQHQITDLGETSEPNGVKCIIHLDMNFFCSAFNFIEAVGKYLLLFPVKPKVYTVQDQELTEVLLPTVEEYEDFFLVRDNTAQGNLVAVEGSVLEVPQDVYGIKYNYKTLPDPLKIIPKLPFNSVSFGEGREVIEKTPNNIQVYRDLVDRLEKKYLISSDEPNYLRHCIYYWYDSISYRVSYYNSVVTSVIKDWTSNRDTKYLFNTVSDFIACVRNSVFWGDTYFNSNLDLKTTSIKDCKIVFLNTSLSNLFFNRSSVVKENIPDNTLLFITKSCGAYYKVFKDVPQINVLFYDLKNFRKDFPSIISLVETVATPQKNTSVSTDSYDRVKLDFKYSTTSPALYGREGSYEHKEFNLTWKQFIKFFNSKENSYYSKLYFVPSVLCSSDEIKNNLLDALSKFQYKYLLIFEYENTSFYLEFEKRRNSFDTRPVNLQYLFDFKAKDLSSFDEHYDLSLIRSFFLAYKQGLPYTKHSSVLDRFYNQTVLSVLPLSQQTNSLMALILYLCFQGEENDFFNNLPDDYKDLIKIDSLFTLHETLNDN